ncbi:hypothetical protein BDZ45DRAFT_302376 [Acephala macrosclerotiorum]|nr:hypothetical protein BDZ45DRAFT_302376 [Acephala macrosclerotiorum]
MASPVQQEMSTLTGPPPESSVRDFAAETVTGTAVEPVAEHTVDPSAAAVAALQDLARGPSPNEEITFTVEPDSISCIGEKTQISQLKALRTIFCRMLRTSSKGYSTLQRETLELLPYTVDSIIQYMNQQVKAQEEMQGEPLTPLII